MKVKRPWGSYTVLNQGDGFKVKLVEVLPYERLSLQRHKFRSEHWVVVEGKAKVTSDKKTYDLEENRSFYVPKNTIHRLENHGDTVLKIVEVQCGGYLQEDDIERFEDDYGREGKRGTTPKISREYRDRSGQADERRRTRDK